MTDRHTMPEMIRLRSVVCLRYRAALADLGRWLMMGAALIVIFATTLCGQPPHSEQDIKNFLGGFVTAWNEADTRALAAMFAPNAALHTPSGQADSRAEIEALLERQQEELFNGRRMSVQVRGIRLDSPHDANVETDFLLDGYSAMGVGSAPPGSLFFALRKDDGHWQIKQAVMQR